MAPGGRNRRVTVPLPWRDAPEPRDAFRAVSGRRGARGCGTGPTVRAARAAALALRARVEAGLSRGRGSALPAGRRSRATGAPPRAATSPAGYRRRVASVIARIRRGDFFQA